MSIKKKLQIVRHAKSSWDLEGISDIDRPLKLRGIRDAYEMARRIKIEQDIPELLISSPANRALHTAIIFLRVFELPFSKLIINNNLYESGYETILGEVMQQDNSVNHLMIFGHNPDFSGLASEFAGRIFIELPTCGVYKVSFSADKWASISKGNVVHENFDFPKRE